jgi:hypothetical protein
MSCDCKVCSFSRKVKDETDVDKLRELALFALEMYLLENMDFEMYKLNQNETAQRLHQLD